MVKKPLDIARGSCRTSLIQPFMLIRATADRGSAHDVFTSFDGTGWPSASLAFLTGVTGPVNCFVNADSSVHLGEEIRDAAYVLPRSMVVTAISNYILSLCVVGTSSASCGCHRGSY